MKKTIVKVLLVSCFFVAGCTNASEKVEEEKATASKEKVVINDAVRSGKEVYESACMVCHVSKGKPTIAPPIFAVKNHVIKEHPEREDFIQRIVDWVKKPDADNALMRGAIKKFGLMPPMPQIDDKELQAVAEFLYDTDLELPDWYRKQGRSQQKYRKNHRTGSLRVVRKRVKPA